MMIHPLIFPWLKFVIKQPNPLGFRVWLELVFVRAEHSYEMLLSMHKRDCVGRLSMMLHAASLRERVVKDQDVV